MNRKAAVALLKKHGVKHNITPKDFAKLGLKGSRRAECKVAINWLARNIEVKITIPLPIPKIGGGKKRRKSKKEADNA